MKTDQAVALVRERKTGAGATPRVTGLARSTGGWSRLIKLEQSGRQVSDPATWLDAH